MSWAVRYLDKPCWTAVPPLRIELFDFPCMGGVQIVDQPAWSLKNEEFFRIGVVDRLRVVGVQLVDRPRVEPEKK